MPLLQPAARAVARTRIQFSDFARWQRRWSTGDAATRQVAYWKKRLREASPVFAATNRDVAGELTARIAQERFHLSNDLVARLSALGHSRGATLFMTLLAGFKTLLLLRSGRNDICVATTMANRSQPGTERVIGPFANTTLIRTQIDADLTFRRRSIACASRPGGLRQAGAPFDIVAADSRRKTVWIRHRSFRFYFVLQVAFRRPIKLHDVAVRPFGYREGQVGGPADRSHLAQDDAQGDHRRHYRRMQV